MRKWMFKRSFAVAAGLVVGALTGLAVYGGSRLSGASLFVLCGTVAGGVAALVIYGHSRAMRLTELKVSIPHVTDLTFAVTPTNEGIAWRLFVESATRISTQPLDDGSGVLREALNSLFQLFQSVRTILLTASPSTRTSRTQTVEHLAIAMLNLQMRPFMSKWHARLTAWEKENPDTPEAQWPANGQCRAELERMRVGLLKYVEGLGELAGVTDVRSLLRSSPAQLHATVPGQMAVEQAQD